MAHECAISSLHLFLHILLLFCVSSHLPFSLYTILISSKSRHHPLWNLLSDFPHVVDLLQLRWNINSIRLTSHEGPNGAAGSPLPPDSVNE